MKIKHLSNVINFYCILLVKFLLFTTCILKKLHFPIIFLRNVSFELWYSFFLIIFVWNVEQYFTSFVKVFIWFPWFSVIRQLWNWLVTQIFVSKVGSLICWKILLNCSSSYQRCPLLFCTLWSQFDLLHTLKIAFKKHSVIELSFLLPTRFMNFLICLTFYNW